MFNTCIKSRLWGNKDQQNYFNYITDCRKSEFLNLLQIPQAEEHLISWVNKAMLDEADCSDWGFLCGIFFSFCLWVFVCLFACWLFFFFKSPSNVVLARKLLEMKGESLWEMWTSREFVHGECAGDQLFFFVDPHNLCASEFRMKFQTSNKEITALSDQIAKAV